MLKFAGVSKRLWQFGQGLARLVLVYLFLVGTIQILAAILVYGGLTELSHPPPTSIYPSYNWGLGGYYDDYQSSEWSVWFFLPMAVAIAGWAWIFYRPKARPLP